MCRMYEDAESSRECSGEQSSSTLGTVGGGESVASSVDPLLHNVYAKMKPVDMRTKRRSQSSDTTKVPHGIGGGHCADRDTSNDLFIDELSSSTKAGRTVGRTLSGGAIADAGLGEDETSTSNDVSTERTSPMRLNANIRRAIQGSVIKGMEAASLTFTPTPIDGAATTFSTDGAVGEGGNIHQKQGGGATPSQPQHKQQTDGAVFISRKMNCLTNVFTAIGTQQKVRMYLYLHPCICLSASHISSNHVLFTLTYLFRCMR